MKTTRNIVQLMMTMMTEDDDNDDDDGDNDDDDDGDDDDAQDDRIFVNLGPIWRGSLGHVSLNNRSWRLMLA